MRLWVDANTPPPPGFHDWSMTGEDTIAIMESGKVTHVSITFDLSGKWDGFQVLLWMDQHNRWPKHGIHVHGGNKTQRAAMEDVIWARYHRRF